MEFMYGMSQTATKKNVAKKEKGTKDNMWNYKGKEKNGLENYRSNQARRDSDWKKTGRQQVCTDIIVV